MLVAVYGARLQVDAQRSLVDYPLDVAALVAQLHESLDDEHKGEHQHAPHAAATLTSAERRHCFRLSQVETDALAAVDLFQCDVQIHNDVGSFRRLPRVVEFFATAASTEASKATERVAKWAAKRIATTTAAAVGIVSLDALFALLVEYGARVGVAERLVGSRQVLELLVGVRIVSVAIRMQLLGKASIGLLDVVGASVARQLEYFVEIASLFISSICHTASHHMIMLNITILVTQRRCENVYPACSWPTNVKRTSAPTTTNVIFIQTNRHTDTRTKRAFQEASNLLSFLF